MIDDSQKIEIPSKTGGKGVQLELNWNSSVSPTDVRVTMGEESAVVDLKDLYFFVFTAGTAEMQDNLMPVRQTQVYKLIKQHRIVAKKNIKPGEMIIANCEVDIPVSVVDTLRGELFKKRGGLGAAKGNGTFGSHIPLIKG